MPAPDLSSARAHEPGAGARWQGWKDLIASRLTALVSADPRYRLHEAMRYALLAPGKRVRPLITLATAQLYGAQPTLALDAACAVELVHTASLIFDDLPCMDDARLRRGCPATHVAFGESTAVLAAIGLIGLAFEATASAEMASSCAPGALTRIVASAIGANGLAGGQYNDLNPPPGALGTAHISLTHGLKTGALFSASAEAGAVMAGACKEACADMRAFGLELGLMFQQLDDVVDATSSEEQAGKDVRRDVRTVTMIKLAGTEGATIMAHDHMRRVLRRLEHTPRPNPLEDLLIELFSRR